MILLNSIFLISLLCNIHTSYSLFLKNIPLKDIVTTKIIYSTLENTIKSEIFDFNFVTEKTIDLTNMVCNLNIEPHSKIVYCLICNEIVSILFLINVAVYQYNKYINNNNNIKLIEKNKKLDNLNINKSLKKKIEMNIIAFTFIFTKSIEHVS